MKKVTVIIFSILVTLASYLFYKNYLPSKDINKNNSKNQDPFTHTKSVKINGVEIFIEIAKTESQRRLGLSGRDFLAENEGMLFDFGQKDIVPYFWMKDMKFPIDIIWINDDTITQIDKDAEPKSTATSDNNLKIYSPSTPIDYVLELNAGTSDQQNIQVGDKVYFENVY